MVGVILIRRSAILDEQLDDVRTTLCGSKVECRAPTAVFNVCCVALHHTTSNKTHITAYASFDEHVGSEWHVSEQDFEVFVSNLSHIDTRDRGCDVHIVPSAKFIEKQLDHLAVRYATGRNATLEQEVRAKRGNPKTAHCGLRMI